MLTISDFVFLFLVAFISIIGFVQINGKESHTSNILLPTSSSSSSSSSSNVIMKSVNFDGKKNKNFGNSEIYFSDIPQNEQNEGSGHDKDDDDDDLEENSSGKGDDDEDNKDIDGSGSGPHIIDETDEGSGDVPDMFEPKSTQRPNVTTKKPEMTKSPHPKQETDKPSTVPKVFTPSQPTITYPTIKSDEEPPGGNEIDTDYNGETQPDPGIFVQYGPRQGSPASFFARPGILAAVIGGAVVGLLCAILLVMFIIYRMRKKDEGSYVLDEPKRSPSNSYARGASKEFYA